MATTIFRFYNTETTTHFYTANPDEVDVILETLPHYRFEGPKFNVEAGNTNVFRLFNLETGAHLYTTDQNERSILLQSSNFRDEGVAYTLDGSGTDVHRYFHTHTGTHFFTNSETEKADIDANLPHLRYEGVAYRANPTHETETGTAFSDTINTENISELFANVVGLAGDDNLSSDKLGWMFGGPGDDTITFDQLTEDARILNSGADFIEVYGGSGADTFVIQEQQSTVRYIHDFDFFEGDRIKLVNANGDTVAPTNNGNLFGETPTFGSQGSLGLISGLTWGSTYLTGTVISDDFFI